MTIKYRTKFGPQPIREIVQKQGLSYNEFARLVDIKPISHVTTAMSGRCPPREDFRKKASKLLNTPIADLFTSEALAAEYYPNRIPVNPRGRFSK